MPLTVPNWRLGRSLGGALCLLIIVSCSGSNAMAGMFGSNTLFSAVAGTVVLKGEPVAGAIVEQRAKSASGDPVVRTTTTDATGHFQFDEIAASKGFLDFLPSEYVVHQELNITHNEQTIEGWQYTKRDRKPGSETAGKKFLLQCELAEEPDFTDNYFGVCRLIEQG